MLNNLEKRTTLVDSTAGQATPQNPGLGRRSFLKRLGLGGTALAPAAGWLASAGIARAEKQDRGLSRGDAAILRFLAAAELLETDLWQQYNEIGLGNPSFQQAISALDGDMPTYINQNTRDEMSHAEFLNAYWLQRAIGPSVSNRSGPCRAARRPVPTRPLNG